MDPDSALVLRGFGAEPGDFRARQLAGGMATDADLTYRRNVLQRDPRALARTFMLREAADLLERVDGGSVKCHGRSPLRAAGRRGRRHVRDPVGQALEVHDEIRTLIVETLLPVLRAITDLRPL